MICLVKQLKEDLAFRKTPEEVCHLVFVCYVFTMYYKF